MQQIKILAKIGWTEPHLAYAAFTHGLKHRYTYTMRTIPGLNELLTPLDDIIDQEFIPSLLNGRRLVVLRENYFFGGFHYLEGDLLQGIDHFRAHNFFVPFIDQVILIKIAFKTNFNIFPFV